MSEEELRRVEVLARVAMKSAQQIRRIEKILRTGGLSSADPTLAHQLIHDLRTGLGYKF